MPRSTPAAPRTHRSLTLPGWPSDEDTVDGQASGPPVSPGPDSDVGERARRPSYGDAECLVCSGSGLIEGETCSTCEGTGLATGPHGSE